LAGITVYSEGTW